MAAEQQGIMSLPQGGQEAAPQLSIDDSYDAISGALGDANPEAGAQLQQLMAQLTPMLDQLPDEQLDAMIQIFQYLHDHPEEYAEKVAELVQKGVIDAGMLPEKYDPELIAALGMVFLQAKKERQAGNTREMQPQMPMPPATMARGGIAEAARMVASQGRKGDTMLAHINKDEARLLKARGGSGTINPKTGLPEYWNPFKAAVEIVTSPVKAVVGAVRSVTGAIADAVKPVLSSPVGRILATAALATFIGPAAFGTTGAMGLGLQYGLASAAVTALGGGSLKDVLRSGATSFLTAALAPGVGSSAGSVLGVTSSAGQAALGAGITGAGVAKLSGQSLQDAIKSGMQQGVIAGAINLGNQLRAPVPEGGAPVEDRVGVKTPQEVAREIAQGGKPQPIASTWAAEDVPDWDRVSTKFPSRFNPANPMAGAQPSPATGNALLGPPGGGTAQQMATTGVPGAGGVPNPPATGGFARIGGGIADLAQGNFEQGWEGIKGGAGDLYNKISPSGIRTAGIEDAEAKALERYKTDIANQVPEKIAASRYEAAVKAGTPGFLSTYGPITAAGLGIAALAGGFKPTPAPRSALADQLAGNPSQDLINANPRRYIPQNLPGVEYDESGNIIGSRPWEPSTTVEDIRRPMPGTTSTFNPPMYTPPAFSLTQQPTGISQPYNTASMYTNLMPPMYRQYAEGGDVEPVHMFFGGILEKIRPALEAARNVISPPPTVVATATPTTTPVAAPVATTPVGPSSTAAPRLGSNPAANAGLQAMIARMYPSLNNAQFQQRLMAPVARLRPQPQSRGLDSFAEGGYPRRTGQISGPGTEKSDSIPAMLSDGEFVMTAKAVRGAGNGSRRAGAKKMYALMHQLERNASRG